EEFQAQADLANHLLRDLGLRAVQLQAVEILEAFAQREVADFVDRAGLLAIPDLDVPGLAAQARAVAFGTRLLATVARQFLPHRHRIALAVTPFHVGNYAFKRVLLGDLAAGGVARLQRVAEPDWFIARAMQDRLPHRLGQFLERRVEAELVVLRQAFEQGEVVAVAGPNP